MHIALTLFVKYELAFYKFQRAPISGLFNLVSWILAEHVLSLNVAFAAKIFSFIVTLAVPFVALDCRARTSYIR